MRELPTIELTIEQKVYEYIVKILQGLYGEQYAKLFVQRNKTHHHSLSNTDET